MESFEATDLAQEAIGIVLDHFLEVQTFTGIECTSTSPGSIPVAAIMILEVVDHLFGNPDLAHYPFDGDASCPGTPDLGTSLVGQVMAHGIPVIKGSSLKVELVNLGSFETVPTKFITNK